MPQPFQVSADRARVATALRGVLAALNSHPIRTSRLSQAWDGFRAAFGDGPAPAGVSLDGAGLPDLYGMRVLLRTSAGITSEERDVLGDVVDAMTGSIFLSAWIYRDAAGDPEPSAAAIREHEQQAEAADDALIRDAKKAIRAAVSMLGGPGDNTSPSRGSVKSVPPDLTESGTTERVSDVSPPVCRLEPRIGMVARLHPHSTPIRSLRFVTSSPVSGAPRRSRGGTTSHPRNGVLGARRGTVRVKNTAPGRTRSFLTSTGGCGTGWRTTRSPPRAPRWTRCDLF
jgi:hypothetical protein